ncbi:MAG: rRNA maturation RNase YbeY [Bacilli bacterium]|jgi:probable rRNA maturation factor|nr:rRNA maturation RNase YbeY [Bacilli bacterium]
MNNINFFNKTNTEIKELNILKDLINYAVKEEKVGDVEFSIVFINNDEMKVLNQKYRGVNCTTDVLSFSLNSDFSHVIPNYCLLGDIYISFEQARMQAELYNHSLLRELAFLMIHGFLHLLGYDHEDAEMEEKMLKRQEVILNEFGIKK